MTLHRDSQGWRVACLLLANEVRRLRAGVDVEPDEVLVAIKRREGYEDAHPELLASDGFGISPFQWRVLADKKRSNAASAPLAKSAPQA